MNKANEQKVFTTGKPQHTQVESLESFSLVKIQMTENKYSKKKKFINLLTNVQFLFSADSICYILWCKSESSSPRFNKEPSEKSDSLLCPFFSPSMSIGGLLFTSDMYQNHCTTSFRQH